MTEKQQRLIKLLEEMFQLNQSDLDFGIYRIMNAKADEISTFLDKDLISSIKKAFTANGNDALKRELEERISSFKNDGFTDEQIDSNTKIQELRAKLSSSTDSAALENDVYSHLSTFFSRYYKEGDFVSLRRYKKDTYAIPYEGEEVKLHWANSDQYYIKTSEYFRDYTFKAGEKTIHFKLIEADTEKNNNKASGDKERRFVLYGESPVEEKEGEFYIYFEYKAVGKEKQEKLNEKAVETILGIDGIDEWKALLETKDPTDKNKERTLLQKHLKSYTSRNSFDYFIHKDLGGFLSRELDFYIKNEMLYLDDIEEASTAKIEESLNKIKTFKTIARKIIAFLTQLEEFQKSLWLKKKFVIDTNYCITLDKMDGAYYEEILACKAQLEEWESLFGIKIASLEDLKDEPYLVLDTKFFDAAFKNRLLSEFDNLDEAVDGVLINSENFGALNLLKERFKEQVKSVYIDPPYNSGGDGFMYKDNYRNSSWLTMLQDRVPAIHSFMRRDGVFFASIDDKDEDNRVSHRFMQLLEDQFGRKNYLDNLIWVKNTTHNDAKAFSHNHEYILAFSKNREEAAAEHAMFRQNKPGYIDIMELVHKLQPHYPPISEIQTAIRSLYKEQTESYKQEVIAQGLEWNKETKRNDPWKGIKQYKHVEYRLDDGTWISEEDAKEKDAKIWVYRESDPSWPNASSLTVAHRSEGDDEYRFYKPNHPITKQPCPAPARGWLWRQKPNPKKPDTQSFELLDKQHLIAYGGDENKIPQIKRFLQNVDTDVMKSIITDFTDGEKELAHVIGERGTFANPKPTSVIQKLIEITTGVGDTVMDAYVGSGSTLHAVLKQNFADEKTRKYLFMEMGEYFETTLLKRAKRLLYSIDWKDGQRQSDEGISQMFKYFKLESYEDTLNNIAMKRTKGQQGTLDANPSLKEDYLLNYMLDYEANESLLNIDNFARPFDYKLHIATGSAGETKETAVDLVETFNYLIGLKVKSRQFIKEYLVIEGENLKDEKILIIWREGSDNEALNSFFSKMDFSVYDREFDTIYVNGDNNLANLKKDEEHFKVKLIEEEFKLRMFA